MNKPTGGPNTNSASPPHAAMARLSCLYPIFLLCLFDSFPSFPTPVVSFLSSPLLSLSAVGRHSRIQDIFLSPTTTQEPILFSLSLAVPVFGALARRQVLFWFTLQVFLAVIETRYCPLRRSRPRGPLALNFISFPFLS